MKNRSWTRAFSSYCACVASAELMQMTELLIYKDTFPKTPTNHWSRNAVFKEERRGLIDERSQIPALFFRALTLLLSLDEGLGGIDTHPRHFFI